MVMLVEQYNIFIYDYSGLFIVSSSLRLFQRFSNIVVSSVPSFQLLYLYKSCTLFYYIPTLGRPPQRCVHWVLSFNHPAEKSFDVKRTIYTVFISAISISYSPEM